MKYHMEHTTPPEPIRRAGEVSFQDVYMALNIGFICCSAARNLG